MARPQSTPSSPFLGRWRIVSMSAWDQEFVDRDEPAFVKLSRGGRGEFHFGCVHGVMDYRVTQRDGEPAVEWSWEGHDEMDLVHGRGWATVRDGEVHGCALLHDGDASAFVATQSGGKERRR